MERMVLVGRFLFSAIFIVSSFGHFSSGAVQYASGHGVPWAQFFVPFSGVLALFGGLSVLVGYFAKIGAALLVAFLIPVTLMMHNFWTVADANEAQIQMVMFMKNVSMLGGAFLIAYFGAGPFSLDNRRVGNLPAEKAVDKAA